MANCIVFKLSRSEGGGSGGGAAKTKVQEVYVL